jgi:hypothetical protein
MKRRVVITAALCLLLGAAVNVLVAWGCALWSPRPTPPFDGTFGGWSPFERYHREPRAHWLLAVPDGWPAAPAGMYWFAAHGAMTTSATCGHDSGDPFWLGLESSFRTGYPWLALASVSHGQFSMPIGGRPQIANLPVPVWGAGLRPPEFMRRLGIHPERMVPLLPLWPGFVGNTLIYALAVLAVYDLALVARGLRRWRRRRRGLCPACGYPVGVSPVCTECGAPVRRIELADHRYDGPKSPAG